MSRITVAEAQAWAETTKMPIGSLDVNLLAQIEEEVIVQLASAYDTSTWVDDTTTPRLVRVAIAKLYVAWLYRKAYSEDPDANNNFQQQLENNANMIIQGLIDGTLEIPGVPGTTDGGSPSFYPTDASSAMDPTYDDMSLGPARFSMGKVF